MPESEIPKVDDKFRLTVQSLGYKDTAAIWVEQQREVKLLPDDNPDLVKGKKRPRLLGPLWQEGNVWSVLEISSKHTFTDKNLKNFYASMLALTSEAMYRVHLKAQRREAFQRRENPYTAGSPIRTPNQFYGRTSIVRKILDGIHQNHFLIEDERRIGKTSLLYHLKFQFQQMLDHEYAFYPVFLNIEATTEKDFWRHLRDSVFSSITGKSHQMEQKGYNFFNFQDDLDTILEGLESQGFNKNRLIVFLIDEVDQFRRYSEELLSKFRRLFQEEPRLKLIMAGVKIKRHLNQITSPWYNQLIPLSLNAMTKQEARMLITDPVKRIYNYTSEAIDLILEKSNCKPLEIQSICLKAVNAMWDRVDQSQVIFQGQPLMIVKEDVERIVDDPNS